MRRMLLDKTVESLLQEGKSLASRGGIVTKRTAIVHYNPSNEWDLESSLDTMLSKGTHKVPTYQDMFSRKTIRSKRFFVILADKSNSLGPTIDYVALAVSILAAAVRNEEYAILFFDDNVKEVKSVRSFKDEGEVLEEILDVTCGGATNLHRAFEEVSNQLAASPAGSEGICVLVSDCIPTVGPDPLEEASLLPQIEILFLPNKTTAIGNSCIDTLESLPRARVREIRELNNIVEAIQDIVSYGSLEVSSEYGLR